MSLEFLYNGQGYTDAEAGSYYMLRRQANDNFFNAPLAGLSALTLAEALNTDLPFLRRYYVMGQYQVREIENVLDVYLRYVYSVEERSGQASTIVEWQVSDHVQLFNINSYAAGGENSEFNSLLSKSFIAGVEAHF